MFYLLDILKPNFQLSTPTKNISIQNFAYPMEETKVREQKNSLNNRN